MQKCVKGFYNGELVMLSMVYYIIGLYIASKTQLSYNSGS